MIEQYTDSHKRGSTCRDLDGRQPEFLEPRDYHLTCASSKNTQDSFAKCLDRIHRGSKVCNNSGSPVFASDWISSEPIATSRTTRLKPSSRGPPLYGNVHDHAVIEVVLGCKHSRAQNRYSTDRLEYSIRSVAAGCEDAYHRVLSPYVFHFRRCYNRLLMCRQMLQRLLHQKCSQSVNEKDEVLT